MSNSPVEVDGPPRWVDRPVGFFRECGVLPASCALRLSTPSQLRETPEPVAGTVARLLAAREQEVALFLVSKKRRVLGIRRILAQSPWKRPRGAEPRRRLNPTLACRDKWRRIQSLQLLKSFRDAYRVAREELVGGNMGVRFPEGTYWMRLHLGVPCSGP